MRLGAAAGVAVHGVVFMVDASPINTCVNRGTQSAKQQGILPAM